MAEGPLHHTGLPNTVLLNAFELLATPLLIIDQQLNIVFANAAFKLLVPSLSEGKKTGINKLFAIEPPLIVANLPQSNQQLVVSCHNHQHSFAGTVSQLDGGNFLVQLNATASQQPFIKALETQVKDHAIVFLQPNQQLVGWNAAAQALFGFNKQEISDRSLTVTFNDADVKNDVPAKLYKEAEQHGFAEHNGIRIRKDGSKFWANEVITAVYSPDHRLDGYVSIIRDRTEIKLDQEMLERELSSFRMLVSSFPNGTIFFFDNNQCCTLAEGQDCENLGIDRKTVIGKHLSQLFPKAITKQAEQLVNTAFAGNSANSEVAYKEKHFLFNALPVKDKGNHVLITVLICQDISRIAQADKELSRFNNLLVSVFEGTLDVIFVKDLHGKYLMINPAASRYFNKAPQEIIGKDDYALFSMKDAEKIIQIDKGIIEKGIPYTYQRTSNVNGEKVTFYSTKSPMRDHDGKIIGLLGISRDVTERYNAEETLRKAKDDLQKAQEIARICSYEIDIAKQVINWSTNTQNLLGLPPNTNIGIGGMRDLIIPDDVERVYDSYAKAIATKSGYREVFRYRKPNGEIIFLETIGQPIFSKSGKLIKMVGTLQDLTAEKIAEEKLAKLNEELEKRVLERTNQLRTALASLQDKEEHFRALIQNSSDVIELIDEEGIATYFSASILPILGYGPEELLGSHISKLIHPDDYEKTAILLKESLKFQAKPISFVARMKHKDDNWRWMETTINNLLDTPAINAIVVNYHDITDRIKYQEALEELNQTLEERVTDRTQQLERANKELEAFTYSVSHDLRAPLRAIIGFGKVLERDNKAELKPEGARMLQVIMDNSKKMGQLIDDLLEFSRLGRREQKNYQFDTNELVNEIIRDHFTNLSPQITIRVNPMPAMFADRPMMVQVYTNLISNAVKYSAIDKPNQIEIGCTIGDKENIFYISDTGVGFDMRYKDKLFGVFQRLHSAREFEGTGVGLALVHRIILRHGGNIWAEGKVNHGATFYFSISQN